MCSVSWVTCTLILWIVIIKTPNLEMKIMRISIYVLAIMAELQIKADNIIKFVDCALNTVYKQSLL